MCFNGKIAHKNYCVLQRQLEKIGTEIQQLCVIKALDKVTDAKQAGSKEAKFGWDSLFKVTQSQAKYYIHST